jgi:hypothetical protein
MAINDCKCVLEEQTDPDDVDDAKVTLSINLQLSDYMSKISLPTQKRKSNLQSIMTISQEKIS